MAVFVVGPDAWALDSDDLARRLESMDRELCTGHRGSTLVEHLNVDAGEKKLATGGQLRQAIHRRLTPEQLLAVGFFEATVHDRLDEGTVLGTEPDGTIVLIEPCGCWRRGAAEIWVSGFILPLRNDPEVWVRGSASSSSVGRA